MVTGSVIAAPSPAAGPPRIEPSSPPTPVDTADLMTSCTSITPVFCNTASVRIVCCTSGGIALNASHSAPTISPVRFNESATVSMVCLISGQFSRTVSATLPRTVWTCGHLSMAVCAASPSWVPSPVMKVEMVGMFASMSVITCPRARFTFGSAASTSGLNACPVVASRSVHRDLRIRS